MPAPYGACMHVHVPEQMAVRAARVGAWCSACIVGALVVDDLLLCIAGCLDGLSAICLAVRNAQGLHTVLLVVLQCRLRTHVDAALTLALPFTLLTVDWVRERHTSHYSIVLLVGITCQWRATHRVWSLQ